MELRCILLVAVVLPLCFAGQDTNVCSPGQFQAVQPAKPFPTLPDVFHSHIEMDIAANKTTKQLYEIFDAPNNRAFLYETLATGDGAAKNISLSGIEMYNFYSNQIVELIPLPDSTYYCTAGPLDGRGSDTFMFGDAASSTKGFNAKSAFMINSAFPPVYQGQKTLENGVITEMWKDCHYIPALDATVTAEWYFTDPTWTTALGVTSVPVMLKVKGKTYQYNPSGRIIDHSYRFSGFSDFITDREKEHFMIPQGTVCPFLKGFDIKTAMKHDIPPIAQQGFMSFSAELIQKTGPAAGLITDFREWYDNTMMLSRFDYTPEGMATQFFDIGSGRPLTEVHDFLTGLAYKKDRSLGNCTIMPLSQTPQWDVQTNPTDANHVRMKTVKEFFFIDGTEDASSGKNWTYTGQRKLRDITSDIYVAERLGWPAGSPADTKSVWELAFSAADYIDVSSSVELQVQEPMRLWVKIPALDYEMTYNLFDFDETEPDAWLFDVSECYTDDQKTNVNFRIPGDQKDAMETNRKEFTYWLLIDIMGYLDISPIRVSKLEWFAADDNSDIIVQFQLLDPPTMKGSTNDQLPKNYLNPTADAIALLKAAVDGGKFEVEVGSLSTKINGITAIPGSVQKGKVVTKSVKVVQLDAGAAAGIAIAFLVVGAAVGVLVIFLVNKFKGPAALPGLSMSFSPKTFENSN